MTCCLLEKAEREWGPPPSRAIRTPRIFLRIFCAFLRDSGTPIFQAPKRRRKMGAKMGAKICAPKICAKMGAKICAPKMGAKMGGKICAPKICAKNRFEHSVFLEDGSQKKKTQKKSAPNLRKTPAPKCGNRLRVGVRAQNAVACVGLRVGPRSERERQIKQNKVQGYWPETPGRTSGVLPAGVLVISSSSSIICKHSVLTKLGFL